MPSTCDHPVAHYNFLLRVEMNWRALKINNTHACAQCHSWQKAPAQGFDLMAWDVAGRVGFCKAPQVIL